MRQTCDNTGVFFKSFLHKKLQINRNLEILLNTDLTKAGESFCGDDGSASIATRLLKSPDVMSIPPTLFLLLEDVLRPFSPLLFT